MISSEAMVRETFDRGIAVLSADLLESSKELHAAIEVATLAQSLILTLISRALAFRVENAYQWAW